MARSSAKQPRSISPAARKRPQLALPPEDPKKQDDKAPTDDAFLREVDEALRQDEMLGFFKRFGVPLIVALVLGLAGLGGYLWWEGQQKQAADERGEQLIVALDALEARNLKDADAKLAELAEDDGNASAIAAKLLRAGIALDEGRAKDASRLFGEVASDEKAPQPYRDLATLRQVSADFDDMELQAVIDRLKPLAVPGNAWFGVAGELVGTAYLKQGKEDLAGPLFAGIARDEDVPESLRARARQLAGMLGVDAVDDALDKKAGNDDEDDKDAKNEAAPGEAGE